MFGATRRRPAGVGRDGDPEVTAGPPPVDSAPTTPTTAAPPSPFVEVVSVATSGNTYAISFTTREFAPDLQGQHIHFFWNTVPRATAGTNGVPAPGRWLVYAGASPVVDRTFRISARPAGATAICALIGNHRHEIADVDGDGRPEPGHGRVRRPSELTVEKSAGVPIPKWL